MPTNDPQRRRGIIVTLIVLALLAIGFYVAFIVLTITS